MLENTPEQQAYWPYFPTIGALLGAPTTEIWRLLTVIPLGGGLAMFLSFGGAILPVCVEDYQKDLGSPKVDFREKTRVPNDPTLDETDTELKTVVEKIKSRMRQDQTRRMSKKYLWIRLIAMVALIMGAHTSMVVIELVTITTLIENWAQLPFEETWTLFVSDVPYDIRVRGGDSIITKLSTPEDSVSRVLEPCQLESRDRDSPRTEPLIHVIVNSTQEAQDVIARILSLDEYGTEDSEHPNETETRKLQVELNGHIFVKQRRVAHRCKWILWILGVLAKPYDLTKVDMKKRTNMLGAVQAGTQPSQSDVDLEHGLLRREGSQQSNIGSLTTPAIQPRHSL
ncbi:MAG: hypothetical protein Q9213_001228 [Squamulea squamosa]